MSTLTPIAQASQPIPNNRGDDSLVQGDPTVAGDFELVQPQPWSYVRELQHGAPYCEGTTCNRTN